ncbi:hypothetical protein BD410DRAFT_795511 [Rickenella mellea]|uniref:Phytanoyl-CoA dioxygenase n=1 Tax=Rickenella mellea TaxID=50990 RepID=A0A4Y7PLN8_9AGAM|nr:hypothetical protein BD410DRAFT_795511 [Rickenella mellea]
MPSLKEDYDRDGFVIVPGLIPPSLSPSLYASSKRVIAQTRAGQWPHRRTVGKQFPPYDTAHPDSWGVQHLMHPDLGETAFAKWYCSDEVVNVVKELLQCEEDKLQMELFNLLINPSEHAFALRWHRDDVKESATEDEEREALAKWHHGVQWNTALYDDACLFVVPGSHVTPRTSEQRSQSSVLEPPTNPLDMPGAIRVVLKPGESVFYNSNILHTATYSPHERRATLHACMGCTRGGNQRARNILQHGLSWMREDSFAKTLNGLSRAQAMRSRLLEMEGRINGELGYSLD